MMTKLLMGIDVGTSACKVAVFNLEGQVIAQATKSYQTYHPAQGWVEQDPLEWWDGVCAAIREVLSFPDIVSKNIAAIGVDGQSWSAIPIDKEGQVLANTPNWMDNRAYEITQQVKAKIGNERIFKVSGNSFEPTYTTPKILWFKEHQPAVFRQTYKFLQSNSFIVYQLTGAITQDRSQGYGLHVFNITNGDYDHELCHELGIPLEKLPSIYSCHKVVGGVTRRVAELTGLAYDTPVVAGGLDAACGALGAGVISQGSTQEQGGQAGGMSICLENPTAHPQAKQTGENVFDIFNQLAAEVKPGSDGVVFLPYMAGERSPIWDVNAKAVFYGLGYDKTKGHLIRAMMEGTAYALQHNLEVALEAGASVAVLKAMGGAANSRVWTQIKSDVTGKVIQVPASDTATPLGAAILAGVGVGLYSDFAEAVEKTITIDRIHQPNQENFSVYQKGYNLYRELYLQLKDLMHKY